MPRDRIELFEDKTAIIERNKRYVTPMPQHDRYLQEPSEDWSETGAYSWVDEVRSAFISCTKHVVVYWKAHRHFGSASWARSKTENPEKFSVLLDYRVPTPAEVWEEGDDDRFDLLVERELSHNLTDSEREELEELNRKRDRLVAGISSEKMEREDRKERALIELEGWLDKYSELFSKR